MLNRRRSSSLVIGFLSFVAVNSATVDTRLAFASPNTFFHALSHREKRYVTYPSGTAIGLLVAIALPVEVPEENLYFSLNFEANYNLPDNITQYYNSDIARVLHSITRRSTYELVQRQLIRKGYDGEQCLLRLICETASYEIPPHGLLEAVFHVIFRPSTSLNEYLLDKYMRAERYGLVSGNCAQEYCNCTVSLFDLFSTE